MKFERLDSNGAESHHCSRGNSTVFFRVHIPQFVKPARRTFSCRLTGDNVRGNGLLEDLNDDKSYEGAQPGDATWLIEEIWLSVCHDGEEVGFYYGRSVGNRNKYRVDLCISQQWASIRTYSPNKSLAECRVYGKGTRTQVEDSSEVKNRSVAHPDVWRLAHTAKSRLLLVCAYLHFDNATVVVWRDHTDECLSTYFQNCLDLLVGRSEALSSWNGQTERDKSILLERGYRDSVLRMGHFVNRVEKTIPGLTLRDVCGPNGEHLDLPRTEFVVRR